jgi:hypothetical protein
MSTSIQVFKGKEKAKNSVVKKTAKFIVNYKKWILGSVLTSVLIVAGLTSCYLYLQRTISAPTIQPVADIVNTSLYLKSEENFVVTIKNNDYYATKKADNLYEVEVKLEDGNHEYTIYGLKSLKFITIKSNDSSTYEVKIDTTKPKIISNTIQEIYHEPKQVFEFKTSEPTKLSINDKETTCTDDRETYKCSFDFTSEGRQSIAVKLTDEGGNSSSIDVDTLFTPKPTLDCGQAIPTETQQTKISLECKVNKEGSLFIGEKETDVVVNAPLVVDIPLPLEGKNSTVLKFKDTYDLESILELSINRDSTAPIANFNFLDSKKVFQQGTVGIGFTSNENANAKVRFYPINNFFETDQLAKQILGSGNFVYEGGQTFEAAINAGQPVTYSTPNNFALCQVLSATNKNCFSPGIVGIEVILTDALGNSRAYLCNNWLATDTAKLEGLEATTCQERK